MPMGVSTRVLIREPITVSTPLRCRRMARFWSGELSLHWEVEAWARPRATELAGSMPMAVWTRVLIRGPIPVSTPLWSRRMARFWSGATSPHWEAEVRVQPHEIGSAGSMPMAVWTRVLILGPMAMSSPLRCRRMARFWSGGLSPHWEAEARARPHETILAGSMPMAVWTRVSIRGPMPLSAPLRCRPMARFWLGATSPHWEAEARHDRAQPNRSAQCRWQSGHEFQSGRQWSYRRARGAGGWQDSGWGRLHHTGRWRHWHDHTQ